MSTFRYNLRALEVADLQANIDPAITVALVDGPKPLTQVDLSLTNDSAKGDLDAAMTEQGWVDSGLGANPPALPAFPLIRQISEMALAVDFSTGSTAFVDVGVSITLTTSSGGNLFITMSASTSSLVTLGYLRVVIDGVAIPDRGAAHNLGTFGNCVSAYRSVAAGSHTVKVQGRVDAGGTLNIRPATNPDSEHCALVVAEIG